MNWPCKMLKSLVLGHDHEQVSANLHGEVRKAVHDIRNQSFKAAISTTNSVRVSNRASEIANDAIARIEEARVRHDGD